MPVCFNRAKKADRTKSADRMRETGQWLHADQGNPGTHSEGRDQRPDAGENHETISASNVSVKMTDCDVAAPVTVS